MFSCSKKIIDKSSSTYKDESNISKTMNIEKEETSKLEKYIIFQRFHINYPVEVLKCTEEIANEKAIEYEYNSIVKSGIIGEYAMEPNTVNSHVDLAKYLEEKLNTDVNYFREDGTPQILWDFPAPKLTKENVKDITEITKFKKYHVLNADEWGKGDYIVIFSKKMDFGAEGLTIDDFIFEDYAYPDAYASAEKNALKMLLKSSNSHSSRNTQKTSTEQFTKLSQSLKYFKYNAGYDIFDANINIDEVDNFNEEEMKELKNEVDRIWSFIGYTPYIIEEF